MSSKTWIGLFAGAALAALLGCASARPTAEETLADRRLTTRLHGMEKTLGVAVRHEARAPQRLGWTIRQGERQLSRDVAAVERDARWIDREVRREFDRVLNRPGHYERQAERTFWADPSRVGRNAILLFF